MYFHENTNLPYQYAIWYLTKTVKSNMTVNRYKIRSDIHSLGLIDNLAYFDPDRDWDTSSKYQDAIHSETLVDLIKLRNLPLTVVLKWQPETFLSDKTDLIWHICKFLAVTDCRSWQNFGIVLRHPRVSCGNISATELAVRHQLHLVHWYKAFNVTIGYIQVLWSLTFHRFRVLLLPTRHNPTLILA